MCFPPAMMTTRSQREACIYGDARGPTAAPTAEPPPSHFIWRFVGDPLSDAHCKEDPVDARKQKKSSRSARSRRRAKAPCEAAHPTTCQPVGFAYIPEDDGLPCLEVLLSDAFDPLAVPPYQTDPSPAAPDGDAAPARQEELKSRRRRHHTADNQSLDPKSSCTRKKRDLASRGRKRSRADAAADPPAMKSNNTPPADVARPAVWALPRRATVHVPLLRPAPPAAPVTPTYAHETAAWALTIVCRTIGVDVAEGAPLGDVVNALCSMPPALATGRRPHDPMASEPVGWVALMGNHDWSPSAAAIPALWAGHTHALAAVGLAVVAPVPEPGHWSTSEEHVLRVLAAEAHMPWFATRVRAAVDDTLGDGRFARHSLFDAVPTDVFLVASVDAAYATRPYDIYVVPRVDLLLA
ncbi:hypothetical protein pqer_cds_567 [Pandoravirus quercus]|uniref:Uncharacterized protein n=2 Tax=Pandoravirus TaxID=2060084 RepID=A0A2U7U983_9VIRU|nr:hypothetical protein pqer_cds_567 [Pandoravirus quercus]AVK74989.1 hypothetical protein pqer_cds_567 [Pandoravirus quercus]QBZ81177.1 hypothetical protein pclt_cds_584 [Pandoravirus celtis]